MTSLRSVPAFAVVMGLGAFACTKADPKASELPYPRPEVIKDGKIVAQIGDVKLTLNELQKRLSQQSPFLKAQLKDPAQKRKFVENEVRSELLAQEGWKKGLYKDPAIVAETKRAIVNRMMRDQLQALSGEVEISDEELHDAYQRKLAEYDKPEKIRIGEILLRAPSVDARVSVRKRAESIKAEIEKEARKTSDLAFIDAVKKYSEDEATKRNGGDLQFLTLEETAEKFGKIAAEDLFQKIEVGGLLVGESAEGVVILKKTGRRRAVTRTLEMVKPQLRSAIIADKKAALFDAYVDTLKKQSGVFIEDQLIDELMPDPQATQADARQQQPATGLPAQQQPPPQPQQQAVEPGPDGPVRQNPQGEPK